MSAYLFTGAISQLRTKSCGNSGCADTGQVSDSCMSLIVYGGSCVEAAQRGFESTLIRLGDPNQVTTTITKIIAAPLMDQLFTEAECQPIDWSKISEQIQSSSEEIPVEDFEQGYWVDVDKVVSPNNLSPDIAALQHGLDEDIRSGLNWAAEKQFYFLISALSPPPPPPEFTDETDPDPAASTEAGDGELYESDMEMAGEADMSFPEMVDKEVAVLIRARNSVVAAWLWRRYAAKTRLAGNQIRVDPWCGAQELETAATRSARKEAE